MSSPMTRYGSSECLVAKGSSDPPTLSLGLGKTRFFDWELSRVTRVWSVVGGGRLFYIARPTSDQIRTCVDLMIPT
jgi:hypothetical protein